MIKVGITGGIGSGKTTVCKIFESMGVPVYYADDRAKKLMTSDKALKAAIIDLLGKESYFNNGRLNRKFIAQKIFNNKELLQSINSLVHPAVLKDGEKWFEQQKGPVAIKEAALMIESGSYKHLNYLIVVTAPLAERIERLMKRDGSTREKIEARMKNQLSDKKFASYADFIIENHEGADVSKQVKAIYKTILQKKRPSKS